MAPPGRADRSALSEPELVAAANRGEASAMEEIYRRHGGWVNSLAARFTGKDEDALANNPGVEKLWQLRRLRELEDAELTAPGPDARRKIIEASLGSGLVSRYTEILTVDTAGADR